MQHNIHFNEKNFKFKTLNKISNDEINELCKLLKKNLPNDLIHLLGLHFTKKYLKTFLIKNAKFICVFNKKKIIGFILLKFQKEKIIKYLTINSFCNLLLNLLYNPFNFLRIILQIPKHQKNYDKSCEIEYFVVSKKYQSKGIGKKLIKISEKIAKIKKLQKIYTKTYNEKLAKYYINKKKAFLYKFFKISNYKYYYFYWYIK